jgi:hypothetical protein
LLRRKSSQVSKVFLHAGAGHFRHRAPIAAPEVRADFAATRSQGAPDLTKTQGMRRAQDSCAA